MFDPQEPTYIPIVMPNDGPALEQAPPLPAMALSAVYGVNPRLRDLVEVARRRARTLFVDPKTPHFQFEGYMSMPDYRALPYSPGRRAMGTLWEPKQFSRAAACEALVDSVFAVQRDLGADVLLAPYFYVRDAAHPWLDAARRCAEAALAKRSKEPVGVPVSVDIDALLAEGNRQKIGRTFAELQADLFWVTVVNYDEWRASPADARAVVAFLEILQSSGRPVVLSHVGRTGLCAIAKGAAAYASGTYGFESHPRGHFREMMGTRPANTYYLQECLVHLPVRTAQALLEMERPPGHKACDCIACGGGTAVGGMVSRLLALHAMLRRIREVEDLREVAAGDRCSYLVERFSGALQRSADLAARLEADGPATIAPGAYHYLEVLREVCGGQPATIPIEDFD